MEKNNTQMNNLSNSLKAFEKLMKDNRASHPVPEIEIEISEEESPADILLQAAGMLMDCSVMVAKAAFLVGLMEDDEDDEDECDDCPYKGQCGSEYGTMVLVARPNGDNTVMTTDELAEEMDGFSVGRVNARNMRPVPGTGDLYFTIPEKKPLKRGGKTFYRQPAIIFGIDEEAGKVASPNARQLYEAVQYFEKASTAIKHREGGETPVFCFD